MLKPVGMRLQQPTKILPKQNSLVNMTYQRVLLRIESMVERLLLYAISIFKDLAPKKKQLYVTEFYVFRQQVNDLLRLGSELFTSASMTASSRQKKKKQLIVKLRVRQLKLKRKQDQDQDQDQDQNQKQRNNVISITGQSGRGMRIRRAPKRFY